MPLSEHEQRLLEQMEKALYAEDPKFATSLRSAPGARAARGRAALGVLGILAGLGLLIAGVATTIIALGVLGFIVMLVGSVIVYSAFGARPADEAAAARRARPRPARRSPPGSWTAWRTAGVVVRRTASSRRPRGPASAPGPAVPWRPPPRPPAPPRPSPRPHRSPRPDPARPAAARTAPARPGPAAAAAPPWPPGSSRAPAARPPAAACCWPTTAGRSRPRGRATSAHAPSTAPA